MVLNNEEHGADGVRLKEATVKMLRKYPVEVPHLPQDENAQKLSDYFYVVRTDDLVLFPGSDTPLDMPPIDFFFGSNVFLERVLKNNKDGTIEAKDLLDAIGSTETRLINWRSGTEGEGPKLAERWNDKIRKAKRVAYISAHGGTAEDSAGSFWAIRAINIRYGADRIMEAIIAERKYDLVVFDACNKDDIPLVVENNGKPHPDIIRFAMTNEFTLVGEKNPVHFIPELAIL
jgi:hypothetical protein